MFSIEGFVELGSMEIGDISTAEAVARRFSVKKMFLKVLQNPQKDACTRLSLLIKLQAEAY